MKPSVLLMTGQWIFFLAAAPFVSGLIAWMKNRLRMRRGQSVFQPYHNLAKLFSKREVFSETTSWIFCFAPAAVMASALSVSLLVPVFMAPELPGLGDFLALIFIFALGRFFLALAALDSGSAFGGMGSSREMFISSLAEPALCLVVFSVAVSFSSTSLAAFSGLHPVGVSSVVASAALFLVMLAETSRVPVDNQETHLELTMVHEAMVLEYSGRSLAVLEMSSHIKQMVWFFLIAQLIFPIGAPFADGFLMWSAWFVARVLVIAAAVAILEVSVAKMRLFRVGDLLGFAFVLGVIALVCALKGV
ncbi:MAG: NADH-quinone oxidoreductase subunit H [Candidatus Omnitrophota bacterium]